MSLCETLRPKRNLVRKETLVFLKKRNLGDCRSCLINCVNTGEMPKACEILNQCRSKSPTGHSFVAFR